MLYKSGSTDRLVFSFVGLLKTRTSQHAYSDWFQSDGNKGSVQAMAYYASLLGYQEIHPHN